MTWKDHTLMYRRMLTGLVSLALVAATLAAAPASAATGGGGRGYCARQFEQAQRTDMESYRDFELETWLDGHDEDAIAIYSSGLVVQGKDAIADSQRNHFTNRNAVWTWTELTRAVDDCKTGTIVYDATYAIPALDFVLRLIVSVSYTYKHGRWLTVIDQGTEIPLDS